MAISKAQALKRFFGDSVSLGDYLKLKREDPITFEWMAKEAAAALGESLIEDGGPQT